MKQIYFLFASILCFSSVNAQYSLEVETADYNEITGGTSITNGLIWEELEAEMPLGFDFTLEDTTFDTLYITYDTTEGILLPSLDFSQVLPAICGVIAEYGDRNSGDPEMIGQPGGVSDVSYTTIGEVGERIFILQYKNVGFEEEIWDNDVSNDYMNFQIMLFEGSNKVAFHFGTSSINYPESSFAEVSGPAIGVFQGLGFYVYSDDSVDLYFVEDSVIILGDNDSPYLSIQTSDEINDYGDIFYTGVPEEDTKFIITNANLSTQNLTSLDLIKVLANPVDNYLILNTIKDVEKIEIFDLTGRKISSIQPTSTQISVQSLRPGIYIVNIKIDDKIQSIKFIKR